ncbi:MAG: exodeoxyribonuclease VII small subunit [Phycisphaerae bacterium]|nr:exodeoxyribonuclease VII small subunit [Phycisphaerae bacterium]
MAQKKAKPEDLADLSFEQAIDELNKVVAQIEDGRVPLQDCIDQYERGMALIRHCRTILQAAEKRIEQIAADQKKPAETPRLDDEKKDAKNPSEKPEEELF